MRSPTVSIRLAALVFALSTGVAAAHEFTAAILVTGEESAERLAEAVDGFLLAADEHDGHADETSDGHLGGVDVQVLPLPLEMAGQVKGLSGRPAALANVVVVVGPAPEAVDGLAPLGPDSIVMTAGRLPRDWQDVAGATSFVSRYVATYGKAPTEAAAQGYNAARRLDAAIRPLDGLEPRAAVSSALAETEEAFDW